MDITKFVTDLFSSNANILNFFFKSFSVLIASLFLIYTLVFLKQTTVMVRVIQLKNKQFIVLMSTIQVILAFILLVMAISLI